MGLVYVTGISGAGKSAICDELRVRGFEAHDTDREGNAVWVNRGTGEVTLAPVTADARTPEWLEEQDWRMDPTKITALAARALGRLVFLCGSASNEKEVWHLFSKTVYLAIDDRTLRGRLQSRTTNDFGKTPHELRAILAWHQVGEARYRELGSVIVDATRPLEHVVDAVVEASI